MSEYRYTIDRLYNEIDIRHKEGGIIFSISEDINGSLLIEDEHLSILDTIQLAIQAHKESGGIKNMANQAELQ